MARNDRTTGVVAPAAVRTVLVAAVLAASAAGCSQDRMARPNGAQVRLAERGEAYPRSAGLTEDDRQRSTESPVLVAMETLDAAERAFHEHVTTLANEYFEGRGPGTRGNDRAAEYIEFYFKQTGLAPAFANEIRAADGTTMVEPGASYRQTFMVTGDTEVRLAEASYKAGGRTVTLEAGEQFTALGSSASATASGPLVFVGYGIEDGPEGFTSFGDTDDLSGKVAVVLRFEPMQDDGESLWSEAAQWSRHASLAAKLQAVAKRNPAAIVLVNPPGADDPRAGRLLPANASRFGGDFEMPIVMMARHEADQMVERADAQGRSLLDLRRLADAGSAGVIDLPNATASVAVEIERRHVPTQNVGGVLAGRGALADEYVVVGAHFDHLGYGGDGSMAPGEDRIHPGADDNASGTAGVMLAAQMLTDAYERLPDGADARSILFLAFSGEEMGLLGSREFIKRPSIPVSSVYAMLNMDMIGRMRDRTIEAMGLGTAAELAESLAPVFEASGLNVKRVENPGGASDHAAFYAESVPVVHFFTGLHREYHKPTDVAWLVNNRGGAAATRLVAESALALALRDEPLEFVRMKAESQGRRRAASVRLGVMPGSYDENERGLLVGDVIEGGAAEKAGIRKGDRIVAWGGEDLPNVFAYMQALGGHKPGDVVVLRVERDGEVIEVEATLQAWEAPQ